MRAIIGLIMLLLIPLAMGASEKEQRILEKLEEISEGDPTLEAELEEIKEPTADDELEIRPVGFLLALVALYFSIHRRHIHRRHS